MSKKRKVNDDVSTRLYCTCRQPNDENKMMLMCEFCEEWFHPTCVGLDDTEAETIGSWKCPGCIDIMSQNPMLSKKGLLGFQGRVAPKDGWTDEFPVEDIEESVISTNVNTKRHKVEGYNLYREEKVLNLSSNTSGHYTFFKSQCMPSMKSDKQYIVYICLKDNGTTLKWATCSCPAGIDGQCKHIVAVLYYIIDLSRQGLNKIPAIKTCTSKLQTWHVKKPLSDDPLLFSDIKFVRHDPTKVVKRDLSCSVIHHNPVPDFARTLATSQIERMVNIYNTHGVSLPVIDTICANSCTPTIPKQQILTELQLELFDVMKEFANVFETTSFVNAMSDDESRLYNTLIACDNQRSVQIEKRTRMQSKNSFWFEQRAYRITASTFGTFCKLRPTTNPISTFKQKKTHFTSASVQHGQLYEGVALAKYCSKYPCLNSPSGLVVNPSIPFLGASPDLIIKEDNELKLIEVKCPHSLYRRKESIKTQLSKTSFFLQSVNGQIILKKDHDYHYQIQGQLNITGINECKLVVFVPPEDMVVLSIIKDKAFFDQNIVPKLSNIWFKKLLPHFKEQL